MDRGFGMVLDRDVYRYTSSYIFNQNQDLIKDLRFLGGGFGY